MTLRTQDVGEKESLSLYAIETALSDLIFLLETAEDPKEIEVIHREMEMYFQKEIRKVDGIARYIHYAKAQAAAAKAEADRLIGWARRWENRLERVKAATIEALHVVGLKKLESAENRLRLQKNPASVDVYDVAALPDQFLNVTITVPLTAWKQILYAARNAGESLPDEAAYAIESSNPISQADKRAVAEALKRGEKVHGARLAPETEHLRCE